MSALSPKAVILKEDGLLYPVDSMLPVQCTDVNIKDQNQNCYGQARVRCCFKKGNTDQCTQYLCNIHAKDALGGNMEYKYCGKHQKFSDPKNSGCKIM
jgi:hypothetical protein